MSPHRELSTPSRCDTLAPPTTSETLQRPVERLRYRYIRHLPGADATIREDSQPWKECDVDADVDVHDVAVKGDDDVVDVVVAPIAATMMGIVAVGDEAVAMMSEDVEVVVE